MISLLSHVITFQYQLTLLCGISKASWTDGSQFQRNFSIFVYIRQELNITFKEAKIIAKHIFQFKICMWLINAKFDIFSYGIKMDATRQFRTKIPDSYLLCTVIY